jgi:predicted TIM-barrel fold metal-dependent hydrolase
MTDFTINNVPRVVDCDTHFWQPIETWRHLIDPMDRDVVERCLATDDPMKAPGHQMKALLTDASGRRYSETGDRLHERLEYMDAHGIDTQIIFPGASRATMIPDPEVAAAACRAVNRWNAEFAKAAPDRLKPVMLLPWRFPRQAFDVFTHATSELGLGIAFMSPTPPPERRWSDGELDRIWGAMEDAEVVVCVHEFTQLGPGYPSVARDSYRSSYPMMYLCGHTVETQLALMDLIMGGVMERFPRLSFGFVEAHTAWLPGWLAQMDDLGSWLASNKRGRKGERHMSLFPTEFFRRQCFVVSFPDDAWIPEAVTYIGPDNVTLCTDYPHPGTAAAMAATFRESHPDLTGDVQAKIIGGNAVRIFRL